ncbi:MAG: hypothetical protein COT35_09210 [Nitrospirae bacterium CG08_land_8_20_14_0_20_52_24]|nr:MAG: hypothetical protein COT35_09210 [Nitrospirae bacterium CG08_land_8_20_14_0_20_52_24]PIV83974.1 MAG: hypothetical protein COW52_08080 [Nitrospirae bacterium CG17_big_fil_post_rev_8_21_14_2_50_50_9]PIW84887.1 MAG: hypothetical protein COZ95_07445 [Nitrospirae bacterium CG_4_8_14_3_um_filter_50_41]PIX86430.1 MAG: hypothetical protein COZ32_03380 [Nitrospirae bacterium CG_4_10_14_3_um_filter_53_41]
MCEKCKGFHYREGKGFLDESLKSFLERKTFLGALARRRRFRRLGKEYTDWEKNGAILPMPHLGKKRVVSEYALRFGLPFFIETGTYRGGMIYSMLNQFEEIFSIELDEALFQKARQRFAGYDNVHLFYGQSSDVLPKILQQINRPCLFWLDAHWSGGDTAKGELETPIVDELACILTHRCVMEHVLLIDDARCFTGENDYPTLLTLKKVIHRFQPGWIFEVRDDIIRVHPPET